MLLESVDHRMNLYLLSYCGTFWLAAISQCVYAPHLLCSSSGLQWHHVHASNFALPPHRGAWNSLCAFYLCVSFNFCYLISNDFFLWLRLETSLDHISMDICSSEFFLSHLSQTYSVTWRLYHYVSSFSNNYYTIQFYNFHLVILHIKLMELYTCKGRFCYAKLPPTSLCF